MKQQNFILTCAAAVAAMLVSIASAQTTAPAATVRVNTAVIPSLSTWFLARHAAFVPIAQKGDIDVLFMGDSITDFWRNDRPLSGGPWRGTTNPTEAVTPPATLPAGPYIGKPVFDKYFGDWKVANFGIAADTTQGVLWRLQHGEGQGYQPRAVMLMIGTNNTGRNTPPEIAMGVAAIVFEMRKDFPDAKILLLGIFPRGAANAPQRGPIAEINRIISTLNDGQHVFYMDIGDKFLAEDGSIPRDVMSDGLHPTTKGYEIWAQAVKEPLANMLK